MPLPSTLSGRDAILEAARYHPFARLRAYGEGVIGYPSKHSVVWMADHDGRYRVGAVGDPAEILELCAALAGTRLIPRGAWFEMPRVDIRLLTPLLEVEKHTNWSVLWTREPQPPNEADDRVVLLPASEHAAIDSLLDAAFPATGNRPGHHLIRRWYGIYEDGQLAAVGADRSQNGVGYLVAIAVLPSLRGRGYGATLTRRLTREALGESDICALGVTAANTGARRLYDRVGFTESIDLIFAHLR